MRAYTRKKRYTKKRRTKGGSSDQCIFFNGIGYEGLGNQLFIYASAVLAKRKTGLPLCIYSHNANPHSKKDYTSLFDAKVVNEKDMENRIQLAKSIVINTQGEGVVGRWSNSDIEYLNTNKGRDAKLPGMLYHSYKGIQPVLKEIKDTFIHKEFHKQMYKDIHAKYSIQALASAFMHVRRGDYDTIGWSLQINYYTTALDTLEANTSIHTLYIISNDISWCKSHDSTWKKHFTRKIEYTNNIDELETLYFMMSCEGGAIISNSTFSAWGAMIGADMNSKSTIIYPSPWIDRAPKNYKNPFSFPDRWIPVNNENIK